MDATKDPTNAKGKPKDKPKGSRKSRNVANLSVEKRDRKRAIDRQAQRVTRQKRNDYIATLERRVTELSRNQKSAALFEKERQRTAELEEEVKLLRESLLSSVTNKEIEVPCSRSWASGHVPVTAAEPFAAQNLCYSQDLSGVSSSHENGFAPLIVGNSPQDSSGPASPLIGANVDGQWFSAYQSNMAPFYEPLPVQVQVVYTTPFQNCRPDNIRPPFEVWSK